MLDFRTTKLQICHNHIIRKQPEFVGRCGIRLFRIHTFFLETAIWTCKNLSNMIQHFVCDLFCSFQILLWNPDGHLHWRGGAITS